MPVTDPPVASGRMYLTDICMKEGIQWQWDSLSQVMILRYGESQARFLADSDLVVVGDQRIILNEPVKIVESRMIVSSDFPEKILGALRSAPPPAKLVETVPQPPQVDIDHTLQKVRMVMIDAGHGGKDPGAIGKSGTMEKDVVLDIARRLKSILTAAGMGVSMTRETDDFISLQERTQQASRPDIDLFVSIHANANPSRKLQGLEVYCLKDLDAVERKETQRLQNLDKIICELAIDRDSQDVDHIVSDLLYAHKQSESERLAVRVAERTSAKIATKNLGRKKSRFYVLRNTHVPAILVEVGFLSNQDEENLLKTGAYRQRVAEAVAQSIMEYVQG